jgi:hypothetical protein
VLVPLIKDDLRQAQEASERAGMPYYRAAGEKMIEAKPQMKHGEFGAWIKRNFNIGTKHASLYMKLASATANSEKLASANFSSLEQFRRDGLGHSRPMPVHRKPWHDDVTAISDRAKREAERIREAELTRQEERKAEQMLALRLIDIGFKVLAKELHPDRGGSRDAMARLNRVRDRLKQSA